MRPIRFSLFVAGLAPISACTITADGINAPSEWQPLRISGDTVQIEVSGGQGGVTHRQATDDCSESYSLLAFYDSASEDPDRVQNLSVRLYFTAAGTVEIPPRDFGGPIYAGYANGSALRVYEGTATMELPELKSVRVTLTDAVVCTAYETCGDPETVVVDGELSQEALEEDTGQRGPVEGWLDDGGVPLCGSDNE